MGRSDHSAISFHIKVALPTTVAKQSTRLDYAAANWDRIRLQVNASLIQQTSNTLEGLWNTLRHAIDTASSLIPKKPCRTRSKPVWADYRAVRAMRNHSTNHRRYQRSPTYHNYCRYIAARDLSQVECSRARRSFESKLANDINSDPKSFWTYVNNSFSSSTAVGPLTTPTGIHITEPLAIAQTFSTYFASVYVPEDITSLPSVSHRDDPTISNVQFTADSVAKVLQSLKTGASPGPDGITNHFLKKCAGSLAPFLANLFTLCMNLSQTPQDWLKAFVNPIHKKGSKFLAENYRPISLTSAVSKVMERIVADELLSFAVSNNFLNKSQYGFLRRRSCELQLLDFTDWVTEILNDGDSVDVIYLDLAKAFDRVPHERLLLKLSSLGVRDPLLSWIRSFLSNRSQAVRVNGVISAWCLVLSGVIQGSVLGVVLFLIYINDLDHYTSAKLFKFADDSKLCRRLINGNPSLAIQHMASDLAGIEKWGNDWLMSFNCSKCACLHLGYSNPCTQYSLNAEAIPNVNTEKDLGVMVSNNMKASEHCAMVTKKCNRIIRMIKRRFVYLTPAIFLPLYKALIRPRLEYASTSWNLHYQRDIKLLESVQHRATKAVRTLAHAPYEDRLRRLGLQTIKTRNQRADLIMMYRMAHNLVDAPLTRYFDLSPSQQLRGHPFKVRAKSTPKRDAARYAFAYRAVDGWNSLDAETVCSPTLASFKRRLHVSAALPEL